MDGAEYNWSIKTSNTYQCDIYMAGDYDDILKSCNVYCTNIGYCVSVFPCDFTYKFGCETGAKITLINYPRFPLSNQQIELRAKELASYLSEECCQGSYTIVMPDRSDFYTRKPQ